MIRKAFLESQSFEVRGSLDEASLLESLVSTVLIDGLEGARGEFHADVAAELGNPNTLGAKVGRDGALDGLHEVLTDTTLLLSQTAAVDLATGADLCSCDAANFSHNRIPWWLVKGGRYIPLIGIPSSLLSLKFHRSEVFSDLVRIASFAGGEAASR